MATRSQTLKLGNIYCVDWADHFTQYNSPTTEDLMEPVPVRTYGKLIRVTPRLLHIETERRLDMDGVYVHEHTGVLRSAILNTVNLGPDPKRKH